MDLVMVRVMDLAMVTVKVKAMELGRESVLGLLLVKE